MLRKPGETFDQRPLLDLESGNALAAGSSRRTVRGAGGEGQSAHDPSRAEVIGRSLVSGLLRGRIGGYAMR